MIFWRLRKLIPTLIASFILFAMTACAGYPGGTEPASRGSRGKVPGKIMLPPPSVLLGGLMGGEQGMVLALLLAGAMNFATYWWPTRRARRSAGSRGPWQTLWTS
jgi:hypothetical protein